MALLSFKSPSDLSKYIKDNDIRFIDLNFTDLRGTMHKITEDARSFDGDKIDGGLYFDGSSIDGWCKINASDMALQPDLSSCCVDPFAAQKTLKIFCDVVDPESGENYERDPRSIAKKAQKYLKKSGVADTAYFGPEPEFFVFDDVRVYNDAHNSGFSVDSKELPVNSARRYDGGNMGHRPAPSGGYVPEGPVDRLSDIRGEMLSVLSLVGVDVEKHHHEVAPAQCELGIKFNTLLKTADNVQLYKYVVKNVAHAYGKTATFMPKPIKGENGSGMHVHQSLWDDGKPLFAGDGYAGLSETALHYIGGIIQHAQSLNAFTNPTTNSYKRLVPGYEAPVLLAYSARNRSASCRIPHSKSKKGKRVEVRFPDPTANSYLAFAAMVMAGLDGIKNKIHPGQAMDQNLYDLDDKKLGKVPHVCGSLRDALVALEKDHDYLLKGDVFTKDMITSYIALKYEEVEEYETSVHPFEYKKYYSS